MGLPLSIVSLQFASTVASSCLERREGNNCHFASTFCERISTSPHILCVNIVAKITNGVQLLFQVKATFVRLKFPVFPMIRLLGSVLGFWDTLRSTMPMLGEYNKYETYFARRYF